jgi:hypothetical protein
MKSRVLKRPMFRMGGDVENVGIMDGMRNRYAESDPKGVQPKRDPMLFKPSMNDFLINFGLNLASQTPGGNIFQTAAAAAKEPFGIMQAKKMREEELSGDREFQRELLGEKLSAQKEIAEIGAGIKNYETYFEIGLNKFDDAIMAENFAKFMSPQGIRAKLDDEVGSTQFGGFIRNDLEKKDAKQKFLNKNGSKIGKIFYDLKRDKLFKIVKQDETIGLQEVTVANMSDIEGTTMPEPKNKNNLTTYQQGIIEGVEKSQKEKKEQKEKQRS